MRKGNVYHCWVFDVMPHSTYDVKANHYPKSQAMFENASIYVSGPCYVQFHDLNQDRIPIYEDEESLTVSNFRFRKIFITNETDNIITVRIVIYSKNELPA